MISIERHKRAWVPAWLWELTQGDLWLLKQPLVYYLRGLLTYRASEWED